jgi:hypothetical protein
MNLQSSTLKFDEYGEPFHVQQAKQIRAFRAAWKEAGHTRTPRVSVSRSIFALIDDRDRAYFGRGEQDGDQFGYIDGPSKGGFWPVLCGGAGCADRATQGGSGHSGGRHAFVDHPEPTRRCLQRTCFAGNSYDSSPCFGLALRNRDQFG